MIQDHGVGGRAFEYRLGLLAARGLNHLKPVRFKVIAHAKTNTRIIVNQQYPSTHPL
jgi:hypothetical protein